MHEIWTFWGNQCEVKYDLEIWYVCMCCDHLSKIILRCYKCSFKVELNTKMPSKYTMARLLQPCKTTDMSSWKTAGAFESPKDIILNANKSLWQEKAVYYTVFLVHGNADLLLPAFSPNMDEWMDTIHVPNSYLIEKDSPVTRMSEVGWFNFLQGHKQHCHSLDGVRSVTNFNAVSATQLIWCQKWDNLTFCGDIKQHGVRSVIISYNAVSATQ